MSKLSCKICRNCPSSSGKEHRAGQSQTSRSADRCFVSTDKKRKKREKIPNKTAWPKKQNNPQHWGFNLEMSTLTESCRFYLEQQIPPQRSLSHFLIFPTSTCSAVSRSGSKKHPCLILCIAQGRKAMHVTQGVTYILFKSRKTDLNDLIFCYQSCSISRAPFHDLSRSSCLWS